MGLEPRAKSEVKLLLFIMFVNHAAASAPLGRLEGSREEERDAVFPLQNRRIAGFCLDQAEPAKLEP